MKNKMRFWLACPLGIAAGVFVWSQVSVLHPIFFQLTLAGMIPPIVAGISGGFVTGLISPRRKIYVASFAGCIVATVLLGFLLRHGFSHYGHNPFMWYWPAYLPVLFAIGGFFTRRLWAQPVVRAGLAQKRASPST
ncbi:MAG TPA: hypothetical protein VMV48_03815 [Gallionellaceae bacterium]|nr:hypothetical protein [Gallionellaceae bacterium]